MIDAANKSTLDQSMNCTSTQPATKLANISVHMNYRPHANNLIKNQNENVTATADDVPITLVLIKTRLPEHTNIH